MERSEELWDTPDVHMSEEEAEFNRRYGQLRELPAGDFLDTVHTYVERFHSLVRTRSAVHDLSSDYIADTNSLVAALEVLRRILVAYAELSGDSQSSTSTAPHVPPNGHRQ